MKKLFAGTIALIAPVLVAPVAHAQKWADITMTVVLDGKAPAPKMAQNVNAQQCSTTAAGLALEDLVVNPKNSGIANIVFSIDTRKTKLTSSDIHPDLREVPKTKPVLDNVKCQFIPHVMSMRAGQILEVKNSDSIPHNAKFASFENKEENPTIAANSSVDIARPLVEKAVTKVECNIHPWMSAYIFVLDHPYIGVSNADGKIKIEKLPAGVDLDFRIWHENQDKSIEEVKINGKKETWSKGNIKLKLKEGANDLGTVTIDVGRFKK